jgi:hypothetical protein
MNYVKVRRKKGQTYSAEQKAIIVLELLKEELHTPIKIPPNLKTNILIVHNSSAYAFGYNLQKGFLCQTRYL